MLGRLRWLGAGAAIGAGSVIWAQRKARTITDRYRPSKKVGDAVERVSALPSGVRAALDDGRRAMRQREAELRATTARRENGNRPGPRRTRH